MDFWRIVIAFVVAALVFWFGSWVAFPQPWLAIISLAVLLLILFGDRIFATRV